MEEVVLASCLLVLKQSLTVSLVWSGALYVTRLTLNSWDLLASASGILGVKA